MLSKDRVLERSICLKPSLVFIHQYFYPELAGSAQQLTDLVSGLQSRGYSIQVVTGQPSYSFLDRLPEEQELNGAQVHRVPKLQFRRTHLLGRTLSGVSFFINSFFQLLKMDRRSLFVIGSDPPFLPFLGRVFHAFREQPYVLILSDLFPDVAIALGEISRTGMVAKILDFMNHWAFDKALKIVVLGEKMAERVRTKLGGDGADGKIEVIQNWADDDTIRPLEKSENRFCIRHHLENRLVVLFSGNHGKVYNFDDLIQAASWLQSHGDSSTEFLFIGEGPQKPWMLRQVLEKRLKNIRLLPYQSSSELPYSLTCGDVAIIPLKEEVAGLCVPGKLYYALAAGLPLLVIAPRDCEPARIALENDCGWWIPPHHPEEVANLVLKLLKNPSLLYEKKRKARECYEKHFTREKAIRHYASLFSNLKATA